MKSTDKKIETNNSDIFHEGLNNFIDFIIEIIPYLKKIDNLKNLFKNNLSHFIEMNYNLIIRPGFSDFKNFHEDIIIEYLFNLFKIISENTIYLDSNNILYYISKYLIENKNEQNIILDNICFDPYNPKDFEIEANKLIILFDMDEDNKLNFYEFLNLLNITINKNLIEENPKNILLPLLENENLNFQLTIILVEYLNFFSFFHKKLKFLKKKINIEIFEIFLTLDKRNKNNFNYHDLKEIFIEFFKEKIIEDKDLLLFYDLINIKKNIEISVIDFEKALSIEQNFHENYKLLKSFKIDKNNKFSNHKTYKLELNKKVNKSINQRQITTTKFNVYLVNLSYLATQRFSQYS